FAEVVRPLLEAEFPGLEYAAALIGAGSEVLGFDSERSTDHDWGPRLLVFLEDEEAERLGVAVDEMLGRRLPEVFGGYPVAFGTGWRPYQVLAAGRLAAALSGAITDPLVRGWGRPAPRIRSSTARRPSANS